MSYSVDAMFFHELAKKDPKDVCHRALCKYDSERRSYILEVWGDDYLINPYEYRIDRITNNFPMPHESFYIFIMHYLLKVKAYEICSEWISEKDIPGGAAFFTISHEIPTYLISEQHGNNIDEFCRRCAQLHGIPLDMADASYGFRITPRVPVAVLYWMGDDDFPAQSRILYDKVVADYLAPDVIFSLAAEICSRIGSLWHPHHQARK